MLTNHHTKLLERRNTEIKYFPVLLCTIISTRVKENKKSCENTTPLVWIRLQNCEFSVQFLPENRKHCCVSSFSSAVLLF